MEKMTIMERAKQFMPFAALHGFNDAIKEKQSVPVKRAELSEEDATALDKTVSAIKKGDIISIEYYSVDRYVEITGAVTEINLPLRYICIVKTKILFDDLKSIKVNKNDNSCE